MRAKDDIPNGFGVSLYDPANNHLTPQTVVFSQPRLPPWQVLGSPLITGGYLYLYSASRTSGITLARVPATPATWNNPHAYQYRTRTGWSPRPDASQPLITGTQPLSVTAGDFRATGHGLTLIGQTSLAGDFTAWQAARPAGPWRRALTGRVPCTPRPRTGTSGLCRALIGHPELSTRHSLLLSYFDPGNGHVNITTYPW